jgi:Zn-dependent protease
MEQDANDLPGPAVESQDDLLSELKSIAASDGKLNSIVLFVVTLVIFFSAQIVSTKWQDLFVLIAVLLFHELGHLGAMKLLKYNDVKMFFVPFMGAAVSGKSQKETAVKSCVVSLMGPFPGVLLGVALFFLFALTKSYYVFKTAQVMILLNALNLLPIMPLDGGRCIDVLFINRRHFRFVFSMLGAILFLVLAFSSKDFIFGMIGVFSIFGAISNFKLHGISQSLKAEGFQAVSTQELLENAGSLQSVLAKLREKFPELFTPKAQPKAIFNQLSVVVDTVKSVPARLFPKILLLGSYLIFLSAGLIAGTLLMAMNYNEKSRTETIDGKHVVYAERYFFGEKKSECPVNDQRFFHGQGKGFTNKGTTTDALFTYADGYRQGEWLLYNERGDIAEKRLYQDGRLISWTKKIDGEWKTTPYDQLPAWQRFLEKVQLIAQPYKSNHVYFEQ